MDFPTGGLRMTVFPPRYEARQHGSKWGVFDTFAQEWAWRAASIARFIDLDSLRRWRSPPRLTEFMRERCENGLRNRNRLCGNCDIYVWSRRFERRTVS